MTTEPVMEERLAAARRRDQLCDRFERGALPRPTIETLLSETPEPERPELLRELVALEVWRRRKDGETITAHEYLNRFPSLDSTWLHQLLPAADDTPPTPSAVVTPALTQDLGDYELLGELGRGGMGVVYRARQHSLKRLVALKVLRDAAADADERARLRAEAEAAARLQHANIVQVFEVGEHGGAPFLAMELCDGGSLAARLAGTPLPATDAAALVRTLAEAVQHAHERGVVHRDLKPGNVLLQEGQQGRKGPKGAQAESPFGPFQVPDVPSGLTPKIADFGLAKRLDAETLRTQSGDILGTPSYMAPEQALGRSREVGAAADVYSLGAILYECLTGRPPFRAASTLETLRQVVSVEPVPPRQLQPDTPHDLNTICLHCLHKEPARRYATAQALADDLGRFLRGEPVHARPIGMGERLVKWTWRNPLAALLVLALSAGVLATSALAWQAEVNAADARSKQSLADANATRAGEQQAIAVEKTADAKRELGRSQQMLYLRTVAAAQQAWRDNQFDRASALLTESPPELCGWEHRYLRKLVASRGEPFEIGGVSHYRSVVFAPDGTWVAGTGHGAINVWDASTRRRKHVLIGKATRPYWSLAVRPDGKWLAAGAVDGTVEIWDVTTGKAVDTLQAFDGLFIVRALAFSPDGKSLACGGISIQTEPRLRVWDLEGRKVLLTPKVPARHRVLGLAYSPDGKMLATAGDLGVHLWDAATGQLRRVLGGPALSRPDCLAFAPNGNHVAVGYHDFIAVWEMRTGQLAEITRGVSDRPYAIAVRPDGSQMAAGVGNRVLVWDFLNGAEPAVLRGHAGGVMGLAFARDGRIASASVDETVRLWNPSVAQEEQHFKMPTLGAITGLTFLDHGRRLATVNNAQTQLIWDLQTGRGLEGRVHVDRLASLLSADRDGTRLFTWSSDRKLRTWDTTGPRPQMQGKDVALDLPARVGAVTVSRDGRLLASLDNESHVGVWDTATGQRLHLLPSEGGPLRLELRALAFAPDGQTLLTVRKDRAVQAWDMTTGQLRATRPNNAAVIQALACSPDARRHAVGCVDGHVHLWDFDSDEPLFSFKAHNGMVCEIVYTPDGKRVVTAGKDGAVRVWDVASGQEALTLRRAGIPLTRLAISPDGSKIAAADGQGNIGIWDAGPETTR